MKPQTKKLIIDAIGIIFCALAWLFFYIAL